MGFLKNEETARDRRRESEKQNKQKLGYGYYLGLKIRERNHDNAHSLREMMNAQGAK